MTATTVCLGHAHQHLPVVLDTRVVRGSGGGPDKTILNSPRFLATMGYRMLCAYMHAPDDPGFALLGEKARAAETVLLSVHDRGPWDGRVFTQMLELCRREHVQIWHGHDYKSNVLGLLLQPFWPMRLVTTVHGWGVTGGRNDLYYHIDRWTLPHYERVLCVSADLHAKCLSSGVPEDRCLLLENGIDTEHFRRRRTIEEAKAAHGIPASRFVVGGVGRLSAEKGFDVLIAALANLVQEGIDALVLLVGEGEDEARLRELAHARGLAERVRFAGYTSDPRQCYEAMDVFALSSLREGLPNVVLEALAMHTPVVATRIAGVPRLIQDGANGLLVASGSSTELSAALLHCRRDPALCARLVTAGRSTVERSFSFVERMQKLSRIYDELLGCSIQRPSSSSKNGTGHGG